jgi:hypothetical protein
MNVRTLTPLSTPQGEIPAGKIVSIPDHLLEKLRGRVEPVERLTCDPPAWLVGEELRTGCYIEDLPAEIVKLTRDNLHLQRQLLARHCEAYDRHHIWRLWELWGERAAIMEHDGGLSREEAETQAAEQLHLTAFLGTTTQRENTPPF